MELNFDLIVIGDIHGCLDQLTHLLTVVGIHGPAGSGDYNKVVLVGDLIAKGDNKHVEVLQFVKDHNIKCVMGNHDHQLLVEALDKGVIQVVDGKAPYEGAGKAKGKEHWEIVKKLRDEDKKDLLDHVRSFPLFLEYPEHNLIIVHAGLDPGAPLNNQDPKHLMNLRDVVKVKDTVYPLDFTPDKAKMKDKDWKKWTKQRKKIAKAEGVDKSEVKAVPWINAWNGGADGKQIVVFGHNAARGWQEHPRNLAFGIDTACLKGKKGGRLTGMMFFNDGTRRKVQVPGWRSTESFDPFGEPVAIEIPDDEGEDDADVQDTATDEKDDIADD